MAPARQSGKPQPIPRKDVGSVPTSRRRIRVMSLTPDQRKQIVWLYDQAHGDADYVAERVTFALLKRADVFAVVLYETRKAARPNTPGMFALMGAVA